ncbi:hypothetical protein CEXT_647491 [Caerostris extrusa]|uniref:Uncharacterized protein n=1 Tax=Caerostris extrusa TaxID=172846 RepID=A0AAV4XHP0_CAEEX|nr:hypothetical protein CEXT_647491 [Caerostris extrusa]
MDFRPFEKTDLPNATTSNKKLHAFEDIQSHVNTPERLILGPSKDTPIQSCSLMCLMAALKSLSKRSKLHNHLGLNETDEEIVSSHIHSETGHLQYHFHHLGPLDMRVPLENVRKHPRGLSILFLRLSVC